MAHMLYTALNLLSLHIATLTPWFAPSAALDFEVRPCQQNYQVLQLAIGLMQDDLHL